MGEQRLRWGGNLEAQRQADAAFGKAKAKRKRKFNRKQKRRGQLSNPPAKIDYYRYIASAAWRKKRTGVIQRKGGKCQRCGSTYELRVHHRHYKTLGRERDKDLEVLCVGCHENEHEGDVAGVLDPMTREFVERFRD